MPCPLAKHTLVSDISTAAVVGAGTIGTSWAALFAANGLRTVVYDPNPKAEEELWVTLLSAKTTFRGLDRYQNCSHLDKMEELVSFTTDLSAAVSIADIIQENGPESLSVKVGLLQAIEMAAKPDALILSSTSGIMPSKLQENLQWRGANFLVGHPFNPPHLIPLVEVVGGYKTSSTSIERALAFYRALGKQPIHIVKEVPGHVTNRLQAALFREILYLLQNGVVSIADMDAAMENGLGMRWASLGPSLSLHLGGGPGGAHDYASKYMPHLMTWTAPESPSLEKGLMDIWVQGTMEAAKGKTRAELERQRDVTLTTLLNTRTS